MIVIIPARSGSKRIPKKNIKLFFGKPIIAYSIELALQSEVVQDVYVSTDSDEIKEIAIKYGAKVPFLRATGLADDYTPTVDVVADAIKNIEVIGKVAINTVCCLYPICPLITIDDIKKAYDQFSSNQNVSYVSACTKFNFPVQRGFYYRNKIGVEMVFPDQYWTRSQDLETVFHEAGAFWIGNKSTYISKIPFMNSLTMPYIIPSWRVQYIDDDDDWQRAEKIYQATKQ
jgi:N-acylneuraminate cytidylyltransferase